MMGARSTREIEKKQCCQVLVRRKPPEQSALLVGMQNRHFAKHFGSFFRILTMSIMGPSSDFAQLKLHSGKLDT